MCRIEAGDARGDQGKSHDTESKERSSHSRDQSQQPLDRPPGIGRREIGGGTGMRMDAKPAAPLPLGLFASSELQQGPPPSPHEPPHPVALATMNSISSTMTEASTASAMMQGAFLPGGEAGDEEGGGRAGTGAQAPMRVPNQVVGRVVGRFTCYACRQAKKPCDKRHPCGRCVKMNLQCVMQTRGRGRPSSRPRDDDSDGQQGEDLSESEQGGGGDGGSSDHGTDGHTEERVVSNDDWEPEPIAVRTRGRREAGKAGTGTGTGSEQGTPSTHGKDAKPRSRRDKLGVVNEEGSSIRGTGIGGCYCAVLHRHRPREGRQGGGGTEARREDHTMRVLCPPGNFEAAHEACALAMQTLIEAGNMHNGRAAMARLILHYHCNVAMEGFSGQSILETLEAWGGGHNGQQQRRYQPPQRNSTNHNSSDDNHKDGGGGQSEGPPRAGLLFRLPPIPSLPTLPQPRPHQHHEDQRIGQASRRAARQMMQRMRGVRIRERRATAIGTGAAHGDGAGGGGGGAGQHAVRCPAWVTDLWTTGEAATMYVRLEKPCMQHGFQVWSPPEVQCSPLMCHLFATPSELRAMANTMRTTLIHAPAGLMSPSTVAGFYTNLTRAAFTRNEGMDRHSVVELVDRNDTRIRCLATVRMRWSADEWEWALRFWPFYTLLNIGPSWQSLDGVLPPVPLPPSPPSSEVSDADTPSPANAHGRSRDDEAADDEDDDDDDDDFLGVLDGFGLAMDDSSMIFGDSLSGPLSRTDGRL